MGSYILRFFDGREKVILKFPIKIKFPPCEVKENLRWKQGLKVS